MAVWVPKVDNVDDVAAAHINLLQTLKQDIDGAIALTGTDQWDKGADVASAATLLVLGDGQYFVVTGNVGITAIQASQSQPGTLVILKFSGTPTLTHHAVNLILPWGVNITAVAGDVAGFVHDLAGNKWRCVFWNKPEMSWDLTPELGGELDAGPHTIGFTQQTATGDGTTTIDWKLGNKFYFTYGVQNDTFTFTAPSNPCSLILVLKQDGVGGRTPTWPGTVLWPDAGTEPTWSSGAGEVDIVSFYYDGTSYHAVSALDFQ